MRFVASVTVCVALCVKDDNDYLNGRYNESSVDVRSLQFAGTDEVSWLYRQSSAWLPCTNLRSPDHQYTIHWSIALGNFQLGGNFYLKQSANYNYNENNTLRETQTLRAGCSKAEQNFFAPPQTLFPGARHGQNLISWRWSLPSPIYSVW